MPKTTSSCKRLLKPEKHFGAVVLKPAIDASCLTTGQLKEQTTLFGKNVWKMKSTFADAGLQRGAKLHFESIRYSHFFCNAVPVTEVKIKDKYSKRDIKERQPM